MSNDDVASQWPPASPKDVLRLTPKKPGHATIIHSSPLRNSTTASPTRGRRPAAPVLEDSDATTSEEDEETLQLQLKAIEAKLKLKKLQKEKKRKAAERVVADGRVTPPPSFESSNAPDVQIPVSPSPRKRNIGTEDAPPGSPSRVLLGIDKGLKARDVSLKRAPGMTNLIAAPRQPQFTSSMSSTASTSSALLNVTKDSSDPFAPKTKTFSERIAEQRSGIQAKEQRAKDNEKLRSKGWGLKDTDVKKETTISTIKSEPQTTAVYRTASSATTSTAQSTNTKSGPVGRLQTQRTTSVTKEPSPPKELQGTSSISGPTDSLPASKDTDLELGPGFDSYTGLHLSRRNISHMQLSRHLNEKEIFLLPALLKIVHSPEYDPPDVPGDWVVMGIVSSKSEPREVQRQGGGKYVVIQITDFKWELEVYFFGDAFQKYYRIAIGTVIAILNPNIMRPRNNDSGKFSLTLSSSSDTLMEVGVARDLGACKAMKRDGKECGTWIDKRHTEYCDFHVEQAVSKARAGRMEINSMGSLFEPPKKGEMRPKRNFLRGGRQVTNGKEDGLMREGPIPDLPQRAGGGGGNVYVSTVSTARLLDHDMSGLPSYEAEKAERLRKTLAKREKEREIAKGLVAGGNSNTGMDYLQANIDDADGKKLALGGRKGGFDPTRRMDEAASRGTLEMFKASTGKMAAGDVSLSPVKSKRKSADMAARNRDSPSPPLADEREKKRTRKADDGAVGWAQVDVKKHLERKVVLTSTGGLKQTQLWKTSTTSRSRSRSPEKRVPVNQGFLGLGIDTSIEPVLRQESIGSPTKSSLKVSDQRRDSKSVKFAPMPMAQDDSSDDDLEILGM